MGVGGALTRRLRGDPPTEKDVRNAINRATVGATRIEVLLSESVVAEGQDRVLTLPWTWTPSRRRREIIQVVGEAQQPLRATTLTAGSTNSYSTPPRPSSRSPFAKAGASARFGLRRREKI